MQKIVIFGAGGFGTEVAMTIKDINKSSGDNWDIAGYFDDNKHLQNAVIDGMKVLGGVEELLKCTEEMNVVIAINNPTIRKDLSIKLRQNDLLQFPNVIHPSSIVYHDTCSIGIGNIILLFTVISYGVTMGDFNIINSYSGLGHHTMMGSYNSFNPRVAISGRVTIGDLNEFGMNSSVIQNKSLGSNNMIGANSLLLRNIEDNNVYFGVPAKKFNVL